MMTKIRRISTYLIIVTAFAFSVYFFVYPFFGSNDSNQGPFSTTQDPNSIPTLTNDVDSCASNPTSDCDQEMLQIEKFCNDNKGQDIPVCSDSRVQQYIEKHGLQRPVVNTGS